MENIPPLPPAYCPEFNFRSSVAPVLSGYPPINSAPYRVGPGPQRTFAIGRISSSKRTVGFHDIPKYFIVRVLSPNRRNLSNMFILVALVQAGNKKRCWSFDQTASECNRLRSGCASGSSLSEAIHPLPLNLAYQPNFLHSTKPGHSPDHGILLSALVQPQEMYWPPQSGHCSTQHISR